MLVYQVNENNFTNESIKESGMPIMLMSSICLAVSDKYETLDKLKDYALIVVNVPVEISEKNPEVLDTFDLKENSGFDDYEDEEDEENIQMNVEEEKITKRLLVVKKNSQFTLELNGEKRDFNANNLNLSIKDENEVAKKDAFQPKTMTAQEMLALDWLKHESTGKSSLSMCITIFPKVKEYFENVTGREMSLATPSDADDLSRCIGFANYVRLYPDQLQKMSDVDLSWSKIVEKWDELENLYNDKKYQEVGDILREANKKKSNKP